MSDVINHIFNLPGGKAGHLIILRGLPGAGKSTYAKTLNADAIFSRDKFREYFPDTNNGATNFETVINDLMLTGAKGVLKEDKTVVIDATNLSMSSLHPFIWLALENKVKHLTITTLQTPVEICVQRRQNQISQEVIKAKAARYGHNLFTDSQVTKVVSHTVENQIAKYFNEFAPYSCQNSWLTPVIICDIDGTLANMGTRDPYDESTVLNDSPHQHIVNLVKKYNTDNDYKLVVMSGRTDSCFDDTLTWLHKQGIYPDALLMRKTGDTRSDAVVKRELLETVEKTCGPVEFVLDDRNSVVEMWRKIGIPCLQVAPGDF